MPSGRRAAPPDLAARAKAIEDALAALGKDVRAAAAKAADEVQYRLDVELAKAAGQYPELFADVRRAMRQARRTLDEAATSLGLDEAAPKRRPRNPGS